MKALVFKRYGGPDHVTFADTPRPVPKPTEILVQVHAAGLNPIDNMIPKGTFKPMLRFQLPATLGSDLAGVVAEVGNRVMASKPQAEAGPMPPPRQKQHRSAWTHQIDLRAFSNRAQENH